MTHDYTGLERIGFILFNDFTNIFNRPHSIGSLWRRCKNTSKLLNTIIETMNLTQELKTTLEPMSQKITVKNVILTQSRQTIPPTDNSKPSVTNLRCRKPLRTSLWHIRTTDQGNKSMRL